MQITIYNQQKDFLLNKKSIQKMVIFLLQKRKVFCDEVIIHFVSKKKISLLHEEYFQDPTPTDCISFPLDRPTKQKDSYIILGEIFICPKVALEYAKIYNKDPFKEIILYLVHGILHLLGYDDQSSLEKQKMRRQEHKCLSILEKAGLL